jgi:hypothetical protein
VTSGDRKAIFVSIASFCDNNLLFTLESLFGTVSGELDINVGILDQSFESLSGSVEHFQWSDNVRYLSIHPIHSKGVCWARSVTGNLYDGEDFYLQIDSHTFFKKDWDKLLVEQMEKLGSISDKPIISTYPPPFEFDIRGKPFEKFAPGGYLYALRPKEEGFTRRDSYELKFKVFHEKGGDYARGFHLAGGFIFTLGNFVEEVPYDPRFYFHGEEQGLALRAYTKGWDIFHPRHDWIPLLHLYKQSGVKNDAHHWRTDLEEIRRIKWVARKRISEKRLADLIECKDANGHFGLGIVRSLDQFIDFSGIDYRVKKINTPPAQLVNY